MARGLADIFALMRPVLLDYIFGVAVLTRWGFKADALLDPERGPVFAAPAKGQGTQRGRGSLSHDEGRIRSRAVSRSEDHGMSLEQAEALMAVLAARTPAGRAYAKAQQDKEAAARASIESWVQSTHASCTVSTRQSLLVHTVLIISLRRTSLRHPDVLVPLLMPTSNRGAYGVHPRAMYAL
jgi:hypothetical protein